MIKIFMRARHPFFVQNSVKEFHVTIDDVLVTICSKDNEMHMHLQGEVSVQVIENIWADVFSLVALYLGAYPQITMMKENNEIRDFSKMVVKYNSWNYMMKDYLALACINEVTINQGTIEKFRKLNLSAIHSMEFLISDSYKHVVLDHRLTLLLHIIDGVISDEVISKAKAELKEKYQENGKVGDYKAKAYFLFENFFFVYEDEAKSELLQLLNVDKEKFLKVITDTRNSNSHMLVVGKKKNCLRNGREMLEYFEIVCYILRVYLITQVGLKVDKTRVQEYLYILHDWILQEYYKEHEPIKSNHYKMIQEINEFNEIVKRCCRESRGE